MKTRFLCIEGADGAGTTVNADALAASLRAEGYDALAYHHPHHPAGCDGVARVAFYTGARAQLLTSRDLPDVLVMDRGPMSGIVYAQSLPAAFPNRATACNLAAEEYASEPWRSAPTVILDADDDVLDARLRGRGEDPATAHAERWQWSRMLASCGWVTPVRTDRPVDVVRADLLAWALAALREAS